MKQFSTALIILATLGTILLTGHAFGFKSFGGTGFVQYLTLRIDGVKYPRGSTYTFEETKAISPLLNYSSDISLTVWGEKDTQIEFTDTRPDHFTMRLIMGRITTDGSAIVNTNKIAIETLGGKAEFIHYSWLNKVEITNMSGQHLVIQAPLQNYTVNGNEHVMISTDTGLPIQE
jgi:hypothetical protein